MDGTWWNAIGKSSYTDFFSTFVSMKRLLLILLCLPIFYGCQQQVEKYNKSNVTTNDTLNIERIKIETH